MTGLIVTLGTTRDVPAVTRTSVAGITRTVAPVISGGETVTFDLRRAPHILIAGTTGSGKSVAIHSMLVDLVKALSPEQLGLVLIDPKRVELSDYTGLPHLVGPELPDGTRGTYRDPLDAIGALSWVLGQVEARFSLMQAHKAKDISKVSDALLRAAGQPRALVMVVDELADLMMAAKSLTPAQKNRFGKDKLSDVETTLARILQIGRAAGVHCVLATQRPSSDVVTGVIKANVPTRLTFALQNAIDSRVAMGRKGAEELTGQGDALFLPTGARTAVRLQGRFVGDEEKAEVLAGVAAWQASYEAWLGSEAGEAYRHAPSIGQAPNRASVLHQSNTATWSLADMPKPLEPIGSGKDGTPSRRQARLYAKQARRTEAWNGASMGERVVATVGGHLVVAGIVGACLVPALVRAIQYYGG